MAFSVKDIDGVFVGNDFEVPIEMTNKSSSKRTVNMTITLSSVYYTGVTRQQLKREVHSTVLAPNASEQNNNYTVMIQNQVFYQPLSSFPL